MISFAKSVRRMRKLIIKEAQIKQTSFKTHLPLWLKFILSLKEFILGLAQFTPESKRFFKDQINPFFHNLRYQDRMVSLVFQLPTNISFVRSIFLQLHQYPSSLQRLKFSCQEGKLANCVDKNTCNLSPLSSFKKLDTFALQITQDHNVISNLMDILPSLPHLKSLDILLPSSFAVAKSKRKSGQNVYLLNPQVFSKLGHLSLTMIKDYPSKFATLDLSNLQRFQLSTKQTFLSKEKELFKLLSKMKQLKALDISIANVGQLEAFLKGFFKNMTKLEELTSLKVFFSSSVIEEISADVLACLKKFFQKAIPIEEFALECQELLISTKLPGFLKIFNESAFNLRKFKLKTAPVMVESNYMKPLLQFIEGLEKIQALKLPCLDINSDKRLIRITSTILKLKEIRAVCFGKMGEKINGGVFVENVKKVIEKRGICSFECETSEELKRILKVPFTGSISFEKRTTKNPFLKFLSKDLLTLIDVRDHS